MVVIVIDIVVVVVAVEVVLVVVVVAAAVVVGVVQVLISVTDCTSDIDHTGSAHHCGRPLTFVRKAPPICAVEGEVGVAVAVVVGVVKVVAGVMVAVAVPGVMQASIAINWAATATIDIG